MKGLLILFCCFFCVASATPVFGQDCANGQCSMRAVRATRVFVVREREVVCDVDVERDSEARQSEGPIRRAGRFAARLFRRCS